MKTLEIVSLKEIPEVHSHDYHQLVAPLSGSAEFEIAELSGRLDSGRGCILPSMVRHGFAGDGSNRILLINLPTNMVAVEHQAIFRHYGWFTIDAGLMQLLAATHHELTLFPNDKHLQSSLVDCLLRGLNLRFANNKQISSKMDMQAITDYLARNLDRAIHVADLARLACLSESQFHSQFRKTHQSTPHQYLLQLRLNYACDLLKENDTSIANIAQLSGFSSQCALTHAMKKYLGVSPGKYRQRVQGEA
ncbi:AraC family transcriptional regulator [Pelagibaculum spongiae]|uniref:AraC family transcriptional regulator n=1 Tax=Pelagibaculum spongiae TaxID=2080658 RepID=A0A2V1GPV5_9GAMM|nr:AraC family transcriptional regulator [Pelagibaculum spongiae]PVZ65433.1 AraC family transcriptional regulator [Pelagibaculum spongiae]